MDYPKECLIVTAPIRTLDKKARRADIQLICSPLDRQIKTYFTLRGAYHIYQVSPFLLLKNEVNQLEHPH